MSICKANNECPPISKKLSSGFMSLMPNNAFVITSYSIHYTKLYDKEDLRQNVPLKAFLENPTVNGLCSLVCADAEEAVGYNFTHATDLSHLPLTDKQKRLWIISQLEKTNPAYNIPFTFV